MSITSDDIKNNGYIHPLADAAADEIEQLESRVAQLEADLAEARKDKAYYKAALETIKKDKPHLMHDDRGREMFCYFYNPTRFAIDWLRDSNTAIKEQQ